MPSRCSQARTTHNLLFVKVIRVPSLLTIETGPGFRASLKDLAHHLTIATVSYGVTAWLFAITGPFLIYVNAAKQGNLSPAEFNSWIFGGYFICGLLTLLLTLYYRQPLLAAITIPGGVLTGTALTHLTFSEIIGAYLLTGVFIAALAATGAVKRVTEWLPKPITMAMVAAVLLPFSTAIVRAFGETPLLAVTTFSGFLAVSLMPKLAQRFPPVLGAIVVGLLTTTMLGQASWQSVVFELADPIMFSPAFTTAASAELVLPLALTVIAVQNAQGIAILANMEYQPPVKAVTFMSGFGSMIVGVFGSQSVCLAGPMTGIVTNPRVGAKEARYAAAVVTGLLWILFGLFAPMATVISQILPSSLIGLLAGLALLEVLVKCFNAAFGEKFRLGALFTFIITLSGIQLFNIGAPFWGLIGGTSISLLLERDNFSRTRI
jgi:benzoate membrane transport protein